MKDRHGNKIQEGDTVLVKLDAPIVIGKVGKLVEGGLNLAGSGVSMGNLTLVSVFTAMPEGLNDGFIVIKIPGSESD